MGSLTESEPDNVKGLPGILIMCVLSIFTAYAVAEQNLPPVAGVSQALNAPAEEPAMKIYKYTNLSGVASYSDRVPTGVKYELMQFSCFACNPNSNIDWANTPLQLTAFEGAINTAAEKYRVDPALVRAIIHAESAFKPGAKSKAGALGLMQLMPATAKDMGVVDPLAPEENIHGGVRYLAWLLEVNRGNAVLATAAYNAGPGAVERHGGIPPYGETQTYVKRVKILHERYKKALTKIFSGQWVSQAEVLRR